MASLSLISCASIKDIYNTPTFSENGSLHCVIETSGGTSKKIEFNPETKTFEIDQRNGADRVIPFLPYPANYGFIPSTLSDRSLGGDGDAFRHITLVESIPTGIVVEAIPIAMLKLLDKREYNYKVICVPSDPKKRIIEATTYAQFVKKYGKAKDIIES
ncbi:MAG: inorganic pyrophosphatase [Dokdonia sp.]